MTNATMTDNRTDNQIQNDVIAELKWDTRLQPHHIAVTVENGVVTLEGVSERALFVIDADGIVRWSHLSPIGVNLGAEGILSALEALPSSKSPTGKQEQAA